MLELKSAMVPPSLGGAPCPKVGAYKRASHFSKKWKAVQPKKWSGSTSKLLDEVQKHQCAGFRIVMSFPCKRAASATLLTCTH